jgi:hypothetical protein
MEVGHKRYMDAREVGGSNTELELAHGLYKGRGLNITNCSAKLGQMRDYEYMMSPAVILAFVEAHLNNADVRFFISIIDGNLRYALDPILDSVRQVRNNLYVVTSVRVLTVKRLACLLALSFQGSRLSSKYPIAQFNVVTACLKHSPPFQ